MNAPTPIRMLISRRLLLQASAAGAVLAQLPADASAKAASPLDFKSLPQDIIPDHRAPAGYDANVLVRWGDAMRPSAPAFDAAKLTAADQEKQFGFNCDFVAFMPLPRGAANSDHGLLFVNHEYATQKEMMPAGVVAPEPSAAQTALEQAAIGASVVEIKRGPSGWSIVADSAYTRRITVTTPCSASGPAAGSPRMQTAADPSGKRIAGTLGNCAGGKTPWGTVLTAEENFQFYFRNDPPAGHAESASLFAAQVGGTKDRTFWGDFDKRFDVSVEPREANRFGWMVEIDPYAPQSMPIKRTGLGRFRHEAANVVINHDGRVVVYLGEDRVWGFVFRFVSKDKYDPAKGAANGALLDDGTLYAARFEDKKLVWRPLKLSPERGLHTEADLVIDAREAAKAAGGTPMDRPEDIDTSPVTGHVFVNLTRNNDRKEVHIDAANPRAENEDGHILELIPPKVRGKLDHAADVFDWNVLLLAGPVKDGGKYGSADSAAFSGPDNLAFDPQGRLWIATDNRRWNFPKPVPNGLYACEVQGPRRAAVKFFFNVPIGAELCGPEFTPDGKTLFVAVQHPAEDLDPKPAKAWPDFKEGVPARPSVVAITKKDNGLIGG